jgi:hypothetical protein
MLFGDFRAAATLHWDLYIRLSVIFWRLLMRRTMLALIARGLLAGFVTSACAEGMEPVIVVPGRPGVPVMFWGHDISGAVVEGDWGLARPGQVTPTVVDGGWAVPIYGPVPTYFPRTGHRPRYGRLEVVPPANRRLPPPAEPYYRDWMSRSGSEAATILPPYDPPPVIVAPRITNRHQPGRVQPPPLKRPVPHTP